MGRTEEPLRILIAGAGIAGVATAIAITRISGLANADVHLFEKSTELKEIGASIAISPNGMRTLERLGVLNALDDEVGYRGPSGIPQIFRHWKTNQVVSTDTHRNVPDPRHHTTRFHRGHLHSALLEHVSAERIHLGKSITNVETSSDRVILYFEDGTNAEGDVLIGADGIRSKVRQLFNPSDRLRFSGKVFMRATFDASIVQGKIRNLPADAIHWWGPRDNFFASRIGKGQYTVAATYFDLRPADQMEGSISWDEVGDVRFLREHFKDWNPVVKAITELTPYIRLFPNFVGNPLPTWVFGSRVTLVGDAAHAHGGAFAAGGSLALDDALALALALRHMFGTATSDVDFTNDAIKEALEIYERTRRPHTTRLQSVIHAMIDKKPVSFKSPEEEDVALVHRMSNRPDTLWLTEHDVEQRFQDIINSSKAATAKI